MKFTTLVLAAALFSRGANAQHLNHDDVPWNTLLTKLSDGKKEKNLRSINISPFVKTSDWLDQCVRIFSEDEGQEAGTGISNWNLMDQPSGLCMNTASCAYENCTGPFQDVEPFIDWGERYDSALFTDDVLVNDDRLNLPVLVVHPKHVGDIAETLKFANQFKIGVSVKSTGHSYTGSSTKKNTILLNLRQLRTYSDKVLNGSLVECQLVTEPLDGAFGDACKLAIARNKPAVFRVGGGEVWNDLLVAISGTWNCGGANFNQDPVSFRTDCPNPNENKYNVVSGVAATVGSSGGWLASGGLAATQGMRTFGLGIDQVLHYEMVLPDGRHVRFGPSEWDNVPGYVYPQTRQVKGYCNSGDLSADDESLWIWGECEEEVDFNDLWFAVRGGGGGAYGVITAVYYQLHDYAGQFHDVQFDPRPYLGTLEGEEYEETYAEMMKQTQEFYFRFFHMPESIGVSKSTSNWVSCPDCAGLFGGTGGLGFSCFNGSDKVMIAAFKRFVGSENLHRYEITNEPFESYGHVALWGGTFFNPWVPFGKANDGPPASLKSYQPPNSGHIHVPLTVLQSEESLQKMMKILNDCGPNCIDPSTYIMGGDVPFAGDGMDALPIHRRHGTMLPRPHNVEVTNKLLDLFYDAEDGNPVTGDNYPGGNCHQHASFFTETHQRDDWTKICDLAWDDEMRYEKCFTFQEDTLGVENLKKLEKIHAKVDPNRIFNCPDCVGYGDEESDGKSKKKMNKNSGYNHPPLYCMTGDVALIGDGVCQEALNTQACHYDGGDCN